jgi:hypothetical protein
MAGLVVLGLPVQAAQRAGRRSVETHAALVFCNAQQAELTQLHQIVHLMPPLLSAKQ